ncbi:MAG: AbrB/MazE/SpoVT family DNA-binding domain-containing protein [Acidobacteria bacterium]|nr:AbrB/MazE/SpoVT family DNA-binding domain-containing protein [Acidobacteriota bacterium]MBI3657060.1 AbrB/MazE/SpoVT family DNA-binding domain-containing protein [Acidobacteriota bacterium]
MAIGKIGLRRQVVIPKDIFEDLNMHEGDFVEIKKTNKVVIIKKKILVDEDDTIVTPKLAKELRAAEARIKAGKGIPWKEAKKKLKL